ncbi:MAG: TIM barrel protein [Verrucomicrobiota bacterium]
MNLIVQAGLECVEWGGDIHVPHGQLRVAREVATMTADAGLCTAAYGSYYRSLASEPEGLSFSTVLQTAVALQAPSIRIWAGNQASDSLSEADRTRLTEDIHATAAAAAHEGKTVTLEYHANTLTDTAESTSRLLREAAHPALKSLWQPPNGMPTEECLEGLRAVLPVLDNIHVLHWWPRAKDRHALKEGTQRWRRFLEVIQTSDLPRCALLEFVKDDDPAQFLKDAATLKSWLTTGEPIHGGQP